MSVTILSTVQAMALRHRGGQRPATVIQLDSSHPGRGSPKQTPWQDLQIKAALGLERDGEEAEPAASPGHVPQWAGSF